MGGGTLSIARNVAELLIKFIWKQSILLFFTGWQGRVIETNIGEAIFY